MRAISNKNGNLSSQFDNIKQTDIPILERFADLPTEIKYTPHQKSLRNNHIDVNKDKIKGFLNLEDIFGFCKSCKR